MVERMLVGKQYKHGRNIHGDKYECIYMTPQGNAVVRKLPRGGSMFGGFLRGKEILVMKEEFKMYGTIEEDK